VEIECTSSGSCNGSEEIEVERILVSSDGSKLVLSAKQFFRQSCVPDVEALVCMMMMMKRVSSIGTS